MSEKAIVKRYQEVDLDAALTASPEEVEKGMAKKKLSLLAIDLEYKRLLGRLLTQVDASLSDPVQRKAFKDVVKQIVHGSLEEMFMLSDVN